MPTRVIVGTLSSATRLYDVTTGALRSQEVDKLASDFFTSWSAGGLM